MDALVRDAASTAVRIAKVAVGLDLGCGGLWASKGPRAGVKLGADAHVSDVLMPLAKTKGKRRKKKDKKNKGET